MLSRMFCWLIPPNLPSGALVDGFQQGVFPEGRFGKGIDSNNTRQYWLHLKMKIFDVFHQVQFISRRGGSLCVSPLLNFVMLKPYQDMLSVKHSPIFLVRFPVLIQSW